MSKLAVFFPGVGYTVDKPLLHYSRRIAADAGYEIKLLPYTGFPDKVKNFFGIGDRFGYSIVEGHGHCQLPEKQFPEVQAFIDKFLLGKETDTKDIQVVSGIK